MADTPDFLTLRRNRDRSGRTEVYVRRAVLSLVSLVALAGLLNVFGQRPDTSHAAAPAASLKVYAPSHVRGGIYYQARITVTARADVKDARLVLNSGWAESITINTVEPSPVGEASVDGKLAFDVGHIRAGTSYILFLQLQVNPTNVGHRSQDVALYDGETLLLQLDRTITIWP